VRAEPADNTIISWREILSYGSGSVASNLSWNMVAAYLIVYYTDVALLPVAAVGTLILSARIFDAAIDPFVGLLVDRTHSRLGKARPYILFAALPFAVLCVLCFWVPQLSVRERLVYAYITFGLLGAAYSFLYVPYGAMQPLITTNPKQMLQLSSVRAMGTSAASIFVYSLTLPAVAWFGAGDAQRGYRGAASLFALITMLLYWIVYFNCRERVVPRLPEQVPNARRNVAQMFRNKIWLIAVLFDLLIFVRLGLLAPAMAFYAKEVLHSPTTASILLPVMSVAIMTGGFLAPWYLSRFGKRRGMYLLLGFTMIWFPVMAAVNAHTGWMLVCFFLGTVGNGVQAAMVFTMVTEAVDWQEARFGERNEGLLFSSTSFTSKVGFALGSALLAYVLAYVGYDPHQTKPIVHTTLVYLVAGVPVAVALLQMICIRFYDYDQRDIRGSTVPAANALASGA
jgi:glycoside/pentoside/hexuronide:cation symporter, GPH family